jgi:carbonic anhydrase
VFDAGLGELFVVRVAGGVLNDDALASVDYAAEHLGASLLVVMGHSQCGAIAAAAAAPDQPLTPNLRALLARLEPAVTSARAETRGGDVVALAVKANALRTLADARSRSALLRELEHEGRFAMLGCVYDVASGDLEWLAERRDGAMQADPRAATAGAGGAAEADGSPGAVTTRPRPVPQHGCAAPPPPAPAGETSPHAERDGARPPGARAVPDTGDAPAADAVAPRATWRDPLVLVGALGVLSLVAAALLAIRRR